MPVDRERLIQVLCRELEGQQDAAGRGVWAAEHCQRTALLACSLRRAVGEAPALDDLVYTAALFHDVCHDRATHQAHGPMGAQRARELLSDLIEPALLERVCAIIAIHDDKREGDPYDTATHLVQDADLIDHSGTLEVYACFSYNALHGCGFAQSIRFMQEETIPRWGQNERLLHFDAARAEWLRRLRFLQGFTDLAARQIAGELGSQ